MKTKTYVVAIQNDELIREHHRVHAKTDTSENWTPGPWETVHEGRRLSVWSKDYGFIHTHEVPQVNSGATQTANANARLIAAAPELYAALQDMLGTFAAHGESQRQVVAKAFGALDKARG